MRTLLSATLAVLLVAAVTAQSSQTYGDESSAQALIDQLSHVLSALGGVEGTVSKLTYISGLVKKAYTDDGIGGWMARSLIKMELNQLKDKAMKTEKDIINNLLDQLESKVGLKTYSEEGVAENYIFSEAVKKAIAFIRNSMSEIISEISQAQKEHDEAAGKINKKAMDKLTEHLNVLKEKLRGLGKKLMDKLTGRDQTADVYGDNGGIRYGDEAGVRYGDEAGVRYGDEAGVRYGDEAGVRYGDEAGVRYGDNGGIRYSDNGGIRYELAQDSSYIFSEMIQVAMKQLRERIFKYIEMIAEATRVAQKAFGENKKVALEHLEKLKEVLKKSLASLKDALLGRKSADDLNKEIEEEDKEIEKIEEEEKELEKEVDKATFAVQLVDSQNYFLDDVVKDLIGKLRVRMLEIIKQLGEAKREFERQTGDAKEVAKKHLAELKEKLNKMKKDLMDALFGKKNAEDLEKDLEEKTL